MGTITQLSVRDNLVAGIEGRLYSGSGPYDEQNFAHGSAATAQVYEIVVDTAANDTDYTYTVAGEPITVTSDGSATLAEIADALEVAHNANGIARGIFEAESDGTDTVTLTALIKRTDVEVKSTDANLTVTEATAPDDGGEIKAGKAMTDDGAGGVKTAADGDAKTDFLGVSILSDGEEQNDKDGGPTTYPYHQDVRVLRTGRIYVDGGDTASRGDTVYFGTASGEEGLFYDASGTGRVALDADQAVWHKANVLEVTVGL